MSINIDQLSRLHAATTPGEWGVSTPRRSGREHVYVDCETMVADCCRGVPREQCESNAAWISAAHNAMPALLDELDELRAENEAMRQAERDRCVVDSQKVIRTRLTLPFYGHQAESLGATGYRLGDDEQWEMLSSGVWGFVASHRMEWIPNRKYRLAGVAR